jgi:hypothetical protein
MNIKYSDLSEEEKDSYRVEADKVIDILKGMNYENNKKGIFGHFSKHNSLYLMCDTLEFLKDKDMTKPGQYGNKAKGTPNYGNGEKAIAPYARRCIRDYLLKSQTLIVFKEVDGENIQESITTFNYQTIKSKALLQELAM